MHDRESLINEIEHLKAQLVAKDTDLRKYKTLFECSADALSIIDLATGKFIECNQAAIRLHGVKSEANFLELRPTDISPEYQPCGKSSLEMATEYIEKTVTKGPQLFQWEHSRLDGSTFPCLVSLTALPLNERMLVLAIGRDISELVKTQEELQSAFKEVTRFKNAYLEEKEKFEKFVDLAPIGVAINRLDDGAFDYVNTEFSRFSGYDVDELNQMDYWQLTPKRYEQQEGEQLALLSASGRYGPYNKEYIHKSGYTYPVQLSGVKIANSKGEEFIWSVIQDISKQKDIEAQLSIAKEQAESMAFRMRLANDSAEIGVWEWDILTNELIWDEWMYKLYGISSETFSGAYEAWEKSLHPDDLESAKNQLFDAVQGNGQYDPEFKVIHPNGQIRTIKASAEIIRNDDGDAIRVIGVNYDITDKVDAIKQLELAKKAAEQANHAKSEFLANMSHEIRTPMNAILGGLQMIKGVQLDPKLSLILDNAASSASSLLTIINDILDYSKIEDNKLELEQAPFSMLEVIKSVTFEVDPIVSNKGIELITLVDDNFEDGWLGDVVRVKQILLNLVSNAVKFTEQGSVKVAMTALNQSNKSVVELKVVDTGIGMDDEAQARIFERFSQADSSTTRKFGGTGLGMSITVNLIKMMGGTIDVSSKLNKGTKVTVTLPLEKTALASLSDSPKSVLPPDLSARHILIAEDNDINQVLIESMLSATNAKITMVENGALAVEAIKREHFDLVLMDIQMPVMDGRQALTEIKALGFNQPVIALTANVMLDDVKRYLAEGFSAHIGKPVDMNELYGLLTRYLCCSSERTNIH
ncbi:PAS domain S-box protein [Alteromonas facilis]|uniref:PAS domain-containing hybrid sensor histidine kinase/response regulator n=1 Tax=Alteromonas facilis TaxID=2048004 RepID=UPI0013DAC57D|nr:PAS domain S-box protein [Alteromonas facilis]